MNAEETRDLLPIFPSLDQEKDDDISTQVRAAESIASLCDDPEVDTFVSAEAILGQICNILQCTRANVVIYARELKINMDVVTNKYQQPPQEPTRSTTESKNEFFPRFFHSHGDEEVPENLGFVPCVEL